MKPWLMLLNLKKPYARGHYLFKLKYISFILGPLFLLSLLYTHDTLCQPLKSFLLDSSAYLNKVCQIPTKIFQNSVDTVMSHFYIQRQNQKLREENGVLRRRYYQALALAAENHRLRERLKIIPEENPSFITVRVIGESNSPYQKNIFINGGKKANIELKSAVLSDQLILGRVIERGNYASRVLLITDPQSHIPVIMQKSGIQGILSGGPSSIMKIKVSEKSFYSSQSMSSRGRPDLDHPPMQVSSHTHAQVEKGEYVFSSGQGGIFPPGFIIGRVIDIKDGEIFVESLLNVSQLEYVQVLKPVGIPLDD